MGFADVKIESIFRTIEDNRTGALGPAGAYQEGRALARGRRPAITRVLSPHSCSRGTLGSQPSIYVCRAAISYLTKWGAARFGRFFP